MVTLLPQTLFYFIAFLCPNTYKVEQISEVEEILMFEFYWHI